MTEMSNLLMYSLYAPTWTARKLDKKATADTKAANHVKDSVDAGNFNKMILPDCQELKDVASHIGATRNEFYLHTAPWGEARGIRVGKAEDYMDLMSWFGDRKAELGPLLAKFEAVYASKISEAEFILQDMFNAQDYPPWDVVAARFGLRLSVQPLPNAKDIRVLTDVPAHVKQEIEDALKQEMHKSFEATAGHAYEELLRPISHMAKQLQAYQDGTAKKIYASLVDNIVEMVHAVRRLNVTRSADLESLADEAAALVDGVTQKDLKESDGFRVEKQKAAQALADRIAKFLP
jgi:hypothetical protein